MMVVVAIIAILASMAMPSQFNKHIQIQIAESIGLVERYKVIIDNSYRVNGEFPTNNVSAGIPDPENIKGNYLSAVYLSDGVLHLELGQKISKRFQGRIVSIQPVYVDAEPMSPVSWICGFDSVPDGMTEAGENRTDIDAEFLPLRCR